MAEHLRHEAARRGELVRPGSILTLARFLDSCTSWRDAPQGVLDLLLADALENTRPAAFEAIAGQSGFRRSLAALIQELPSSRAGGQFREPLESVIAELEPSLYRRGFALRHRRLREAAHRILDRDFPFDLVRAAGFLNLTTHERALFDAIARKTHFETLPIPVSRQAANRTVFHAATLTAEVEEIARRILAHAQRGREFREIGVITRVREPYTSALESTFERFGIPHRAYFADPLSHQPAVRFLSGIVRSLLNGWDHEELLKALRMPIAGLADEFDFALRERIPGRGLEALAQLPAPPAALARLGQLDSWRVERLSPEEWAARAKTLRTLIPHPLITDGAAQREIACWRNIGASFTAFDTALDETAAATSGRITFESFWRRAENVIDLTMLGGDHGRRNVVHIMDANEARQWSLPVVFVCGLAEGRFPLHHRPGPLLSDAARANLGMQTSATLQQAEAELFEMACSSAASELTLSYARYDDRGDEHIPSFFLKGEEGEPCGPRVCPAPSRETPSPPLPRIADSALISQIAIRHRSLGPTPIEEFLQCPFQFFGRRTLRLKPRPKPPRKRLDALLEGIILHRALAEVAGAPVLGSAVFEEVFEDECRKARIPDGYRRQASKISLLSAFEGLLADRKITLGWESRVEQKFEYTIGELSIRGRIDRLEIGPEGEALVIDYKYSAVSKIRERVQESGEGNLVQAGLYLLAAERTFSLAPAGMLYCGLKKGVSWGGWHVPLKGLEQPGESVTPAQLRVQMNDAEQAALRAHALIGSGVIEPAPADPDKCEWCEFRDVCRVESAAPKTETAR